MQRTHTTLGLLAIAMLAGGAAGCGSDPATTSTPDSGTPATAAAASLPLTLSDVFAPSGYMGDGATPGGIVVDTTACLTPRPAGAVGDCYKVTYTPGAQGWAGV